MSKWAQAGIGIAVIAVALAVILGIDHRKNSETIEALKSQTTPAEAVVEKVSGERTAAPVTDGIVYEAKNELHPGMTFTENITEKETDSIESDATETEPVRDDEGILTWQGETYKRNAHVKADLLIGVDEYDAADFLAVAVHDTSRNTLKLLLIPRDSMMEMVRTDAQGNSETVISHVKYAHCGLDTQKDKAERTADAVSALLCGTKVDHYMAGDLSLFAEINDMAGGIQVTVPGDELVKADPTWKKGEQIVLHGKEAEKFIRYRDIDTDGTPLLRMDQHKAYIAGFFQKLKEDKSLAGKLSDHIQSMVTSDMSKGEYEKLLLDGLASSFDPQKDIQILPGIMEKGEEHDGTVLDQFYVNYEEEIPILLDFFYRKVS